MPAETRRAEMVQLVTPEEMAALLEELKEAEVGAGSIPGGAPEEIMANRIAPDPGRLTGRQNLSNWLMDLADLRWPHL